MSLTLLKVQYPQNKELAGKYWWGVIHNIAAQYDINPTEQKKSDTKNFFNYLLNNFVCFDCVSHSRDYMIKNPINFDNRDSLTKSFQDMHNYVNERVGKPQYEVELVNNATKHDTSTCTTCTTETELKKNLQDFKDNGRNIILNLCKEAKVSPPNIHFQPCPDNASTSCLTYDSSRMTGEGVYAGDADIFINPYSASLRTIKHETKHYINLKTGGSLGEIEADTFAIDKINKNFEFDTYKKEITDINNKLMDSITVKDNENKNISLLPQQKDIFSSTYDYPSLDRIDNLMQERSKLMSEPINKGNPPEGNVLAIENNREPDFILSGLNGLFAWPASLVGVSPASLNMTYTGGFITKVLSYIIASNFSTFGTSVINFTTAIAMFSGAAIFKNSIGMGDRGVIQGMVAMFLLSGIDSLVPKKREVMSEGLRLFIEGIKDFDLDKLKQSFFLDDDAFTISKNVNDSRSKNKQTVFKGDVANALQAADVTLGNVPKPSMNVSPIRAMQLGSRSSFDSVHNKIPTNYMSGEKNTIPNYSNSTLESIANSYAKKRMMAAGFGNGTLGNLEGLDVNDLTAQLNEIADMEVDPNTYEILEMN